MKNTLLLAGLTLVVASVAHAETPAYVCPPTPGPKRAEALEAFVVWANQNTQFADKSAADTLMRYLGERYPCQTAKKRS
jgi:hypothetical protein